MRCVRRVHEGKTCTAFIIISCVFSVLRVFNGIERRNSGGAVTTGEIEVLEERPVQCHSPPSSSEVRNERSYTSAPGVHPRGGGGARLQPPNPPKTKIRKHFVYIDIRSFTLFPLQPK
jgi:hypothetical protein